MFLIDKIKYAKETPYTVTNVKSFNYYAIDGNMLFDTVI